MKTLGPWLTLILKYYGVVVLYVAFFVVLDTVIPITTIKGDFCYESRETIHIERILQGH